ncbi:MAG: cobalamin-binding protein [Desulfococcus sp. 4484_241]|nr:MAG: cobalamin-binding protein [Desulfococcus sp. 4484_241]
MAVCLLASFVFIAGADARTVIDQTGRSVNIPDCPARVVALAPSITEIIYALGRQDILKGVTQFSDYPPDAMRLPRVGSYVHLDIERIVALKPDLCIAIKDGNPKQVIDRLEELGIPVYATFPTDLATTMEAIERLGVILNAPKAAEDLAAGSGTFINELITLAGGKNIAEKKGRYVSFSQEELIKLSPDIVIITTMARHGAFDKAEEQWKRWPNIQAVKNGRIYLIDSNLVDRPTPRLIDGLERLARLIHPELFTADAAGKKQL